MFKSALLKNEQKWSYVTSEQLQTSHSKLKLIREGGTDPCVTLLLTLVRNEKSQMILT